MEKDTFQKTQCDSKEKNDRDSVFKHVDYLSDLFNISKRDKKEEIGRFLLLEDQEDEEFGSFLTQYPVLIQTLFNRIHGIDFLPPPLLPSESRSRLLVFSDLEQNSPLACLYEDYTTQAFPCNERKLQQTVIALLRSNLIVRILLCESTSLVNLKVFLNEMVYSVFLTIYFNECLKVPKKLRLFLGEKFVNTQFDEYNSVGQFCCDKADEIRELVIDRLVEETGSDKRIAARIFDTSTLDEYEMFVKSEKQIVDELDGFLRAHEDPGKLIDLIFGLRKLPLL